MWLWVDDVRVPPSDKYLWAKSTKQACKFIFECRCKSPDEQIILDLDHDSGDFAYDGGDYIRVLDWLENQGIENVAIHLHTRNPVGRENMTRIIQRNNWYLIY